MIMTDTEKEKLNNIFKKIPQIKLVYLFGSQATDKTGPLSDFDFAIYLDQRDKKKMFDFKFELNDKISQLLKTDKIDIVILNLTESPELKYNIIKEGQLIYEKEPYKVLIEPRILMEYFDFRQMLLKYNLTK